MIDARLIVDAETFRPGGVGPATGGVWLKAGSVVFPLVGWNDFVVVVVEAWAAALLRLLGGSSDREVVHFMDGPYRVELTACSKGEVTLRAIHDRREVACVRASVVPLLESILAGGDATLLACRRHEHSSADVDRLGVDLPVLRRQMMRLRSSLS